jgi:hypothetical protein
VRLADVGAVEGPRLAAQPSMSFELARWKDE